jgi:soluble lytic murein transglycosylase-like protein
MRRIVSTLFSLAALAFAGAASAGTVYRCVGSDGVTSYTSKRAPHAECRAISHTSPSRLSSFSPKTSALMPITQPLRDPAIAAAAPAVDALAGQAAPAMPAASENKVAYQASASGAATLPVPATRSGSRVLTGAIYRFQKDGVAHYTNLRPRGAGATTKLLYSYVETCYACSALPGINFGSIRLNTSAYTNEIHTASQLYGVDEAVVRAIIHAESAYRSNAVSHAGAQGLMQLIPATASRFGVSDPFDPAQNIRGGVQYLAWLMKRYSSNLTLVAAAYNAGEGAVDRNGGVPPYSETRRYVQRVGQLADRYRSALAGP